MIETNELVNAVEHNTLVRKLNPSKKIDFFGTLMTYFRLEDIVGVIIPTHMIQPIERLVHINMDNIELHHNVIFCDKLLSVTLSKEELEDIEPYSTTIEFVGREMAQSLHYEIMDEIYVNSNKVNYRIDLEDDSPSEIMDKLWVASSEYSDDSGFRIAHDKWILPYAMIEKLYPLFYQDGFVFDSDVGLPLHEIFKLGVFRGIKIYGSYRNTVALLCYKGHEATDAGEIFAPFIAKSGDFSDVKRLTLGYGLKCIDPNYFVSIQVR